MCFSSLKSRLFGNSRSSGCRPSWYEKAVLRCVRQCGLQLNFISKKMATLLKLPRSQSNVHISGIGASQVRSVSSVSIKIASRVKPFSIVILCHVLPTIIETFPACPSNIGDWNIPSEFVHQLADPSFKLPRTIDI